MKSIRVCISCRVPPRAVHNVARRDCMQGQPIINERVPLYANFKGLLFPPHASDLLRNIRGGSRGQIGVIHVKVTGRVTSEGVGLCEIITKLGSPA